MHYAQNTSELVTHWQETAKTLREFGAEAQAGTLEKCAEELAEALEIASQAPLTLQEAADLGGYSTDHLGRLLREGKIPNAGRKGAPRIARTDVPIKPGAVVQADRNREISREQIVRSVIKSGGV